MRARHWIELVALVAGGILGSMALEHYLGVKSAGIIILFVMLMASTIKYRRDIGKHR